MSGNANHERGTGNKRRNPRSDSSPDLDFAAYTAANRAHQRKDRKESPASLPSRLPHTHDESDSHDRPNWLTETPSEDDLLVDHALRPGRGAPPIAMDLNEYVQEIMSLIRPVRSAPPVFGVVTTTSTQTDPKAESETMVKGEGSPIIKDKGSENATGAGAEPTPQPRSFESSHVGDQTATPSHLDHSTQL